MFFIQMSGFPGSGKSTLAKEISKRTGAIIIDHDVVKSALLEAIGEHSIDPKLAGKISYHMDWSLIEFHLSLGQSVILDSPCLYQEMVEQGVALSQKYQASYKYVECYLDDFHVINNRLKNRDRMMSQIDEIKSEEAFQYTIKNSKKPENYNTILVETHKPLESYIEEVISYIKE